MKKVGGSAPELPPGVAAPDPYTLEYSPPTGGLAGRSTKPSILGIAAVAATVAGLEAFRTIWFEPRAMALACLHHVANPIVCDARATLGWLTHYQVMGAGALTLGIWSIAGAPFAVTIAAVCLGVAGVIDYNVSWGMLGAALGIWTWLRAGEHGQRA